MGLCLRCCAASKRIKLSLFDDLIDEDKQFSRNLNPVRLCSLKVDDQIKLDHLHHWKLIGLCTFKNPRDMHGTGLAIPNRRLAQ